MGSLAWTTKVWGLALALEGVACTIQQQAIEHKKGAPPDQVVSSAPTAAELEAANKLKVQNIYGKLPLHFEANQGQDAEQVKFLSRGRGYTLILTPTAAVLALKQPSAISHQH